MASSDVKAALAKYRKRSKSRDTGYQAMPYLKKTLRESLPLALLDVCQLRPRDPIEFIARWLYRYVDCELYFYERAIFAKECHLMRLKLLMERARRLANIRELKKQTAEIKFLLQGDLNQLELLWKQMALKAARGKKKVMDELDDMEKRTKRGKSRPGSKAGLESSDMSISSSLADLEDLLGEASGRGKRGRRGPGSDDSSSGTSSDDEGGRGGGRSRRGMRGLLEDEDGKGGRRRGRKGSELGSDEYVDRHGRIRRRRDDGTEDSSLSSGLSETGRRRRHDKRRRGEEGEDDSMSGGTSEFRMSKSKRKDSKSKKGAKRAVSLYGLCHWYLLEPLVLVCQHPILGELRSRRPRVPSQLDQPTYWETYGFNCHVFYDHEIYSVCNPREDDDLYVDRMIEWSNRDWFEVD